METFKIENIIFDNESTTKEEAFKKMSEVAYNLGYVKSASEYEKGLIKREGEVTTGFTDGFAIPHSKNETVITPGVFVAKFANKIDWNSLDGEPTEIAIFLAVPAVGADEHLKLLGLIARNLIHDDFKNGLKNATTAEEIYEFISKISL